MCNDNVPEWLADCKREALEIDPETAEVRYFYVQLMDVYGVHPDLPEELREADHVQFVRRPGSDIWVWWGDLPTATLEKLLVREHHNMLVTMRRAWMRLSVTNIPPMTPEQEQLMAQRYAREMIRHLHGG
jgi:hypothetical protein